MKISLDSAMRARDVSQPRTADEAAAERAEAAMIAGKPGPGARSALSAHKPASTADPERTAASQPQADGPATTNGGPERRAGGRARRRGRQSAPPGP